MQPTGTIYLPTATAVALFEHELKGQFSDGLWENARPYGHWKFWSGLKVVKSTEGRPQVISNRLWECTKVRYNLAALHEYVLDRMLRIGRMAKACELTDTHFPGRSAVEAMPETYEQFREERDRKFDLSGVPLTTAATFYAATYTTKELRQDEAAIKAAMKSAVE